MYFLNALIPEICGSVDRLRARLVMLERIAERMKSLSVMFLIDRKDFRHRRS